MKQYILALDQGTTSSRALLFDHKGSVVSMAQKVRSSQPYEIENPEFSAYQTIFKHNIPNIFLFTEDFHSS